MDPMAPNGNPSANVSKSLNFLVCDAVHKKMKIRA